MVRWWWCTAVGSMCSLIQMKIFLVWGIRNLVYWIRGFRWVKLSGTDLVPGDVVSIGRTTGQDGEDKSVPADMLLLAGNAIANEAILTGESTPQWKVVIISLPMTWLGAEHFIDCFNWTLFAPTSNSFIMFSLGWWFCQWPWLRFGNP